MGWKLVDCGSGGHAVILAARPRGSRSTPSASRDCDERGDPRTATEARRRRSRLYDLGMAHASDEHGYDGVDQHRHGDIEPGATRATVLVYASDPATRERVIDALGEHPAPHLSIDVVEVSDGRSAIARFDQGGIDLAILDGEAAPTGGMGMARQIKDEIDNPPPVLLLVGRRDDAWLATWSRAEAVVSHPIDAVQLAAAAAGLLAGADAAAAH
jgi:hypothetical protein